MSEQEQEDEAAFLADREAARELLAEAPELSEQQLERLREAIRGRAAKPR